MKILLTIVLAITISNYFGQAPLEIIPIETLNIKELMLCNNQDPLNGVMGRKYSSKNFIKYSYTANTNFNKDQLESLLTNCFDSLRFLNPVNKISGKKITLDTTATTEQFTLVKGRTAIKDLKEREKARNVQIRRNFTSKKDYNSVYFINIAGLGDVFLISTWDGNSGGFSLTAVKKEKLMLIDKSIKAKIRFEDSLEVTKVNEDKSPDLSPERYSDLRKADADFRNNKINLNQFPLDEAPPFGQFTFMEKKYVALFKDQILKNFHNSTNKNATMVTDVDNGYIFYTGSTPKREDGYVVLNSVLRGPLGYTSRPDTLSYDFMLGKIEFREFSGSSLDDRLKKIISDLYQGKVKNEEVFEIGTVRINCYLKNSNEQKEAVNNFSFDQQRKKPLLKPVKIDTVWMYDQTQRISGKINGVYFEGSGYAFADAILSSTKNLWKTDYHSETIAYKKQDLNMTAKWAELIPFGLFKEYFLRPASFRKTNQMFQLELDLNLTYFDLQGMKGASCLIPNVGVFDDTTFQLSSVGFKFNPKDLLMNQKRMWPIGHSRDQNLLYETFLDNCVAQYKQYLKDPSVYTKKSYGPSGGGQSNSASVRQCSGRTLKGARCRRRTTSSSGRCFQH